MVDCGPEQGRSFFETDSAAVTAIDSGAVTAIDSGAVTAIAGGAQLRRKMMNGCVIIQRSENTELGRKMPFLNRHRLKNLLTTIIKSL
jgi:hypothetical protein